MEAANWNQVKNILELAIEQPVLERQAFIEKKCPGDMDLQKQVRALVNSYERVGGFMEEGAIGSVAELFDSERLTSGDRLGRYTIVRLLGEGGMGKVYLASDPDLHRQVAIKVLRDDLWWYKQARQRLLREARAAARLDHPNICSVYEIDDSEDSSYIVMQYLDGRTLSDIMSQGGLAFRKSLHAALQIADALEEAHSQHIIHRDIKPANIIINEKGYVKVLDFGLAKSIEPSGKRPDQDLSSSGAVMGTVPYMSPEQLRGNEVDERSDIFGFGGLLYEMIAGRQVFGKESNAETIAAILNETPDLSLIHERLRPLIKRSLEKDVANRYQSVTELSRELRRLTENGIGDEQTARSTLGSPGAQKATGSGFRRFFSTKKQARVPSPHRWQDSDSNAQTVRVTGRSEQATERSLFSSVNPIFAAAGVGVVVLAALLAVYFYSRTQTDPHSFDSLRPVELTSWRVAASGDFFDASSSHNGKMIAYAATKDGSNNGIYIKQIADGGDFRVTSDQWTNYSPIWSLDDQHIAFVSARRDTYGIYTSPFLGGQTTLVKTLEPGTITLRHWANDGTGIYYEFNGNLFRLDLATHNTTQITKFEIDATVDREFSFSPDEKRVVYRDSQGGQTDLWIIPLNEGEATRLTNDPVEERRPIWHPDGQRILYTVIRDGLSHINVAFLDGREPEQITRGEGEQQLIDLSPDGTEIFYVSWESRSDVWSVNIENGHEYPIVSEKGSEFWPGPSPNGKLLVYQTNSSLHPEDSLFMSSVVIRNLDGNGPPRKTQGYDPKWAPDGRHLAFLRWQDGERRNSLNLIDSISGEEQQIVEQGVGFKGFGTLPYNRSQISEFSWRPDGKVIAFVKIDGDHSNIATVSTEPQSIVNVTKNTISGVGYYAPIWSPDGERLAFVSTRGSADNEKPISSVWILDEGSLSEIFSTSEELHFLGWVSNEDLLFESSDQLITATPMDADILRVSLAGAYNVVVNLKTIYIKSMTLSSDGKMIAYTARKDDKDDIYVSSSGGRSPRRITANNEPRVFFGSLAWSFDDKNIFFDKQERIGTISMFENFK